jgi:hypothetical protein
MVTISDFEDAVCGGWDDTDVASNERFPDLEWVTSVADACISRYFPDVVTVWVVNAFDWTKGVWAEIRL